MGVLHKFNPVRLGFIREAACRRFDRDPKRLDSLAGLRILDIGCGGGILCEPLARLGADVVGADPAAANIEAARLHAAQSGLAIDYRVTTAEALADAGERFDVVLAMEVVEHVADVALFVKRCAEMVKPGGLMIAATLNRTLKSFALAIVGAEYVLGWLPRGTHQWDKFVTPDELEAALERARAARRRRDRRDLQSHRRPLADLDRHGRELHGDGGEAGAAWIVIDSSWLWALFTSSPPPRRPCATRRSASSPRRSAPPARPMCASCSDCRSRWCSCSVVLLASGAALPQPAGDLLAVDPAGLRSRRSPPPR